jgi:hypothetical protein
LSEDRRKDNPNIRSLFISTLGVVRPASRTIIGGWVKTVLKEAGIDASAGSTRSAVASLGWLENHPIEDILQRGNWKSENTFKRFYNKEIISSKDSSESVMGLFKAI